MASTTSSQNPNPRIRVRVPAIITVVVTIMASIFFFSSTVSASSPISYAEHCAAIVPESSPSTETVYADDLAINNGAFYGGEAILGSSSPPTSGRPRAFYFRPRSAHGTSNPGVLQIAATLILRGGGGADGMGVIHGRNLLYSVDGIQGFRQFRPRVPRTNFFRRGRLSFDLLGFWSAVDGRLCMVGSGAGQSFDGNALQVNGVFKLNFVNVSTIVSSLVNGSLVYFNAANSSNHLDPILVLAYAQKSYGYTKLDVVEKALSQVSVSDELLGVESGNLCANLVGMLGEQLKLGYDGKCSSEFCGPFARSLGFVPKTMIFNYVQCSDGGKLHMYLAFSNATGFLYNSVLNPQKALVAEGFWDQKRKEIGLVACRISNANGSLMNLSVDDCTIRVSLWFPAVWTIESRSSMVGRIWSELGEKDAGHFGKVSLQSSTRNMYFPGKGLKTLKGCRYKYTRMDDARKNCKERSFISLGRKRYPVWKSPTDFRFNVYIKRFDGNTTWGYLSPVSMGETVYKYSNMIPSADQVPSPSMIDIGNNPLNLSYEVTFRFPDASSSVIEATTISAEGTYNSKTGLICLAGCLLQDSSLAPKHDSNTSSLDCRIHITIQLAPVDSGTDRHIKGTIKSTRDKNDPLYFNPLEIISNAISKEEAVASMWRMDIEIWMVLISLTLSCIFIGLQLFHVKKNPEVLSSISIIMLVILTLGHMIPLVLNFEALFLRTNKQNNLLRSGGWLEVNEVVVRIITMVAFLLLVRLLQVSWTARTAEVEKMNLWPAEKKALKICLPLYISGGLIALLVHMISKQHIPDGHLSVSAHRHFFWGDLLSYAGLLLDGYLLPQIIFNVFSCSKVKALTPYFYVGFTAVRALPHIYDAYRSHNYVQLKSSYIYASPDGDFYSLVWDMIIPCGGVILSLLIFFQQRFGGACCFPTKPSRTSEYEIVPLVSS